MIWWVSLEGNRWQREWQTRLVRQAGCIGLSKSILCSVMGLPTGTAHQRWGKGTRARGGEGWLVTQGGRREGQGCFFSFNLACGGTHRLQARWQSWLACFVQKRQQPRQCRIRPYRNPHSLKPGPHPHSLQQSDTQPQPTALDTPGRGSRPASDSICKQLTAFVFCDCAPHRQV